VTALADETRSLGELAARGARGLTGLIEETHGAIAERSFRGALASSSPVRRGHDAISALTYAAVGGLSAGAIRLSARGLAATLRHDPPLADGRRGAVALGALNGALGDQLAERGDPLAIRMQLRDAGAPISTAPVDLAAQLPNATGTLAVFVHGLCETERAWWWGIDREQGGEPYGARLREDLGHTPLYLRYNSGLHISDNGRRLSELLAELVPAWPVPVDEIVLVGHSMGGLVARSACRAALDEDSDWVQRVRHVFYLGSPHSGADLEKGANAAAWLLNAVPETRAAARTLNGRSAGIKDLRFGYLLDEDWGGRDPDELLRCYRGDVPFLDTATHYFIAASLTTDSSHPLGRAVGDMLVRLPSAWADGQHPIHDRFDLDHSRSLGPLTHFDLLNHPDVYDHMRRWLDPGSPRSAL
jgi:pimeloyl-ACP methyl ester carboxylesterase